MGKCCWASPRGAVSNVRASSKYCGNLTLPVTSSPSTANCWLAHRSPSLTVSCPNTLVGVLVPDATSSLLGCECRPAGHSGNGTGGLHHTQICISNGLSFEGYHWNLVRGLSSSSKPALMSGDAVKSCRFSILQLSCGSRLPSKVGLSKYQKRCHCSLKLKQAVSS